MQHSAERTSRHPSLTTRHDLDDADATPRDDDSEAAEEHEHEHHIPPDLEAPAQASRSFLRTDVTGRPLQIARRRAKEGGDAELIRRRRTCF